MQISKFFLRIAFSISLVLWANTGLFAQDSGPSPLLARDGFMTESYNLRSTIHFTSSFAYASSSHQITQPMSRYTFWSYTPASIAFSIDGNTTTAVWFGVEGSMLLQENFEAASGSYVMFRSGALPLNEFHFTSIGRQR